MGELRVGETVDHFRLIELLAHSGMASTFKAIDDRSGTAAVLKIPHPQFEKDPIFSGRFRREESIGQRLDHRNVIHVLKSDSKSRLYIAMEYFEGESLRARMRGGKILPAQSALGYACQICEALEYIHQQGVVHRDLKPENILVDANDTLKIMDFGLALDKWARRLTYTGKSSSFGTPDYTSPEQVLGQRGDARSDIYALGSILFEMLTGRLPFSGLDAFATMRAKPESDPQPPSAFKRDLDPRLEEIVLHAIARRPQDRYATANAMLAELRDLSKVQLQGRVQRLRPVQPYRERLKRTALVLGGFALLIVIFAGLVFLGRSHR